MRRAKKLWAAGGAVALAHNLTAEDGDTLSEAVDDWLHTHPILTRAVIAMLALHLANAVTQQADPVHWAFHIVRGRSFIAGRRLATQALSVGDVVGHAQAHRTRPLQVRGA